MVYLARLSLMLNKFVTTHHAASRVAAQRYNEILARRSRPEGGAAAARPS
jgi:hypothetical protein